MVSCCFGVQLFFFYIGIFWFPGVLVSCHLFFPLFWFSIAFVSCYFGFCCFGVPRFWVLKYFGVLLLLCLLFWCPGVLVCNMNTLFAPPRSRFLVSFGLLFCYFGFLVFQCCFGFPFVLVSCCFGFLLFWCLVAVVSYCFGVLVFWCLIVLVSWCFDVLLFWCPGVLVCNMNTLFAPRSDKWWLIWARLARGQKVIFIFLLLINQSLSIQRFILILILIWRKLARGQRVIFSILLFINL